jgi:LPS sulfotransferase NodH
VADQPEFRNSGDEMRKTLFLASDVRSGSTYIAESLAYFFDKQFGFLFYDLASELFSHLDDSSSEKEIMERYNTLFLDKSGWASSKIMCASLSIIARESRRSISVQSTFFGQEAFWIIVRRRDKIKQAVSLAIASKSGLYHYYGDGEKSPDNEYQIGKQEIQDALKKIELSDTYLTIFKQLIPDAQYIEIFYEDFLDDEFQFINKVCQRSGLGNVTDTDSYMNLAKLRPTATEKKSSYAEEFKFWFLENYHPTQ